MARNPSGSIYTCPLCDGPIHSATEHMLIVPEGNPEGRRHAHTDCVREARGTGRLLVRTDREQGGPGWGWLGRLRRRRHPPD